MGHTCACRKHTEGMPAPTGEAQPETGRMQDVPPTREASKDLGFWPTLKQQQLPFQQNEIFTGAFLKLI